MSALVVQKRVKNAVLYTNGMIRIDGCRLSFPHLDKPYAGTSDDGKTGKPKYGAVGMLPKATHVEAKNLIVEAINALLVASQQGKEPIKVAADKKFIRNGDDQEREEYASHWTVSAREERRPSVRNQRGELILDASEIVDKLYAGCYVNLLIRPWYQDGQKTGKGYGKRVNAGLVGVQFARDGEPFGDARIDDTDAWDAVEDDGNDGMGDDEL